MTEKMEEIKQKIKSQIIRLYPPEYLSFAMSNKTSLDDIAEQIMMECCKKAYDHTQPKYSIQDYIKKLDLNDDADRMRIQRIFEIVCHNKQSEYDMFENNGFPIEELLTPKTDEIKEKLSKYTLNQFQFWELFDMGNTDLEAAILEGTIFKQNFTTKTFKEYAAQFDSLFDAVLQPELNDEQYVFEFLKAFALESKYSFNFFYKISELAVKNKCKEIVDVEDKYALFCGQADFNSFLCIINPKSLNTTVYSECGLLKIRNQYLEDFIHVEPKQFDSHFQPFAETSALSALTRYTLMDEDTHFEKWFIENTDIHDWASVFRNYGIRSFYQTQKKWNPSKIKWIKKMYESASSVNPQFRS